MGFARQEYWSGLRFASPGDLPDPGIKPRSPALQVDSLPSEPPGKPILISQFLSATLLSLNASLQKHPLTERFSALTHKGL